MARPYRPPRTSHGTHRTGGKSGSRPSRTWHHHACLEKDRANGLAVGLNFRRDQAHDVLPVTLPDKMASASFELTSERVLLLETRIDVSTKQPNEQGWSRNRSQVDSHV
jgi:hypothetical protein